MDEAFKKWQTDPSPVNASALLSAAEPTISSALRSYAGGDKSLQGRARLLALGAFRTYDPAKKTKLQTHLMTQLQPLMRHSRERRSPIHVPEKAVFDLGRVVRERASFRDETGRDPSDKELSDRTGFSHKRILHVSKLGAGDMPESGLTSENDEGEQETFYPGVNRPDPGRVWAEFVHHDLAPIDQMILEHKTGLYGKPIMSVDEIARKLNITSSAVSQRSARIAARLAEGKGQEL